MPNDGWMIRDHEEKNQKKELCEGRFFLRGSFGREFLCRPLPQRTLIEGQEFQSISTNVNEEENTEGGRKKVKKVMTLVRVSYVLCQLGKEE